ncbi:hypothetical protein ACTHAM_001284 [Cellulomonas soli]|uniref:hypothetical protein n=1 Tax=Cellulomonas soli TaxID=931535 RepID=UPI003F82A88F
MNDQIIGWSLGVTETWGGWAPGGGAAAADAVAEKLADNPIARDRVRATVLAIDSGAAGLPGIGLQFGVWVPDRASGEVHANMAMELVVGATTAEDYLKMVRKPPRDRQYKVFHYDTAPAEVVVGPAVIVTRARADRKTKLVTNEIEWTIFPPGSSEVIQMLFLTPVAAFAQAMADESVDMANRLSVTLGQAQ